MAIKELMRLQDDPTAPAEMNSLQGVEISHGQLTQKMRAMRALSLPIDDLLKTFVKDTGVTLEEALDIYTNSGGPPAFDPVIHPEFIQNLALIGVDDRRIASILRLTPVEFKMWQVKHPEIARALDDGRINADAKVVRALHKRATGYDYTEEKVRKDAMGNVLDRTLASKHVIPDTSAAKIWLENKQPEHWKDRQSSDSMNIDLSDEELTLELERAGLKMTVSKLAAKKVDNEIELNAKDVNIIEDDDDDTE